MCGTHLISVIPEHEYWGLRAVGYDACEIDDATLVHVDVGTALDSHVRNCKAKQIGITHLAAHQGRFLFQLISCRQ